MLERQIMFKQLQELQRQKKLEALNDARQQNVMDQLSLMHHKQSSGTQYPLLNNGIPVRDASQMFKFGNTNLLQGVSNRSAQNKALQSRGLASHQLDGTNMSNESASLLTKHNREVNDHDRYAPSHESGWLNRFSEKMENVERNQDLDPLEQKILFDTEDNSGSWSALMQSAVAEASSGDAAPNSTDHASHNMLEAPKAEPDDAFTPTHENSSRSQCFGLKLDRPSQRQVVNYFDPSRTSLRAGHSSNPFQDHQSNNNQLRNQNYMTNQSPLVSVKNEDGQQSSTLEAKQRPMAAAEMGQQNIWVDVPVQQIPSGMGSSEPSRTFRMETASEASKGFDYWKRVKSENLETSSWLKNHEASNNEQMSINDAKARNNASQRLLPPGSLERNSSLVQVASIDQCGPITGTNEVARTRLPSFYSQHLDVANQNMAVLNSKKRKCPTTFERLPWHKQVTEGCLGLHDTSTAEMEWAQSANRLPEKLKEDAREVAHSRGVVHSKRRLDLTTQLMQLLFRPAPAMAHSEDATAHCETVTYYAAKLALGDACSLAGHSRTSHDISGSSSRTIVIPKSFDHQNLSKTIEGFIDRSKRLEDELLRLEKGESSILEIRVEFQDLDKFSVINRFAKFHSRGPLDTESSGGGSTVTKLYPLRYVKASPMPRMVPEGLRCLSL